MRNEFQQDYFDRACKFLTGLISIGVEYPEAEARMRRAFMFKEHVVFEIAKLYKEGKI